MFLEVSNLSKSYFLKKHWYLKEEEIFVFKDISFSLNERENLLICGESGSGKSTLAKILCMLERCDQGKIIFEDQDISKLTFKEQRMLRKDIQYIFQDQKLSLNPYKNTKRLILDVYDNFKLKADFDNVFMLFDEFGLKEDILNLKPSKLSGGQSQRLGLIRALILKPKLLILDEILSALDMPTSIKILAFLKKYQEDNNISYIFISHHERVLRNFYSKKIELL